MEVDMANEKNGEDREQGFVVKDRRFSAKKDEADSEAREEIPREEPQTKEEMADQDIPLPEINFTNFLLSLSTSILIQLGEVQDPMTNQNEKNLPVAKQTIDLLGMLREKTKGNLTPDEEKLFENLLYDLRMRYVRATR
jgi:hypothetical protein